MASAPVVESGLQRWAHPRVLVVTSPETERLLAKNHFASFAELLKPLGTGAAFESQVPAVYFRSVSRNYQLRNYGVRFVAPVELEAAAALAIPLEGAGSATTQGIHNLAQTEAYLDGVLRGSEPPRDRYNDGIQEAGDVAGFHRTTPEPTPWFARYRHEFHEVLRYHEAELIDQPLGLLVAISTADANPLNLIESLRSLRNLPSVFQRGIYDSPSNMLRNIVVVHDKHLELNDPDARERGANVFRLIKKQYGTEVLRLLELNSAPLGQPNLKQKDLWKADCDRARWQAKQARNAPVKSPVDGSSSVAAASSPHQPSFPQPLLPTQAPIHVGTPTINTSGSSNDGTPEPLTPSSSLLAAASNAVASSALAEMGADQAATVEQEQAALRAEEARAAAILAPIATINVASPAMLLSPNTAAAATASPVPTTPFVDVLPANEVRGQYLSAQDLAQTSAFIGDFLVKSLLPHLERRISALGEKVAAVRKGFKNSLKAFFGTGQRDKSKKASYNPRIGTYDWSTIESQARQLADLAFVVQDYELAASTYRVCAGDYKQDKISRHFAGSQEMLALALALGDTSGIISQSTLRELTQALDAAIATYLSIGDVRRATRAAWFAADALRWMGGPARANECSAILLRASEKEQTIRAALSMEQAAYLFLYHLPQPLIRKYSFHLVMSGHLYHKFAQKIFGVRAYNAATILYENRGWFSINDHLHYYLGKEYFHLGLYAESVRHFVKLIGEAQSVAGVKPKQTAEKQRTFLNEFVFVVTRWQEIERQKQLTTGGLVGKNPSSLVPGLKLPTVLDESVQVRTNDVGTVPSCYTIQAWNMALRVNPLMTLDKDLCNKPLVQQSWATYREADRGCIVGETVHVMFSVSNPLLIELPCSNLRLRCKWKKPATDGEEEVESAEGVVVGQTPSPDTAFSYSTLSLTLAPLQTSTISLAVTPLKQGVLYVEGLLWDVMDVLKGFHPFALPMRQVTFPIVGGRRRKPELQPDPSLIIPIQAPAPLLAVELSHFPRHLAQGEVVRVMMRLANHGTVGLHRMCLRLSHPGFMVVAPPQTDPALHLTQACYEHTWNEGYIQLPLTLQPGESVELPTFLRGTLEGAHNVSLLLKYEPVVAGPTGSLKHRLAHLTFPLVVTPLFGMKVFTRPSFQHLKDSLLGIELQDKQQTIPGIVGTHEYASLKDLDVRSLQVHFSQVSVLSKMWTIAPLDATEQQQQQQLLNEEHHNSLATAPPRKLHTSISTPSVSALAHPDAAASTLLQPLAAATAALPPASTPEASSSHAAPPAHILRPYESLVQFFRVTNLPGSFVASPTTAGHHHADAKPVHTSASANNLAATATHPHSVRRSAHHSVVLLAPPHGQALVIEPSHPGVAHLLHMEKALLIEEEKQTLIVNPAAVLADVGATNRLDVVCCWRDVEGARSGFYHAPGLASMKSAPAACSLKVLLGYPRTVVHDFWSSPPGGLDVHVAVAIRNTLEDAPVSFGFETLPPEEEFDAARRTFRLHTSPSLRGGGRYTWSGSTRCRVTDLAPGEQVGITLYATFPSPGVYNLNRFRFTVEQPGKKPRVFFFPLQHLIHVTQADSPQPPMTIDASSMPTAIEDVPIESTERDLPASTSLDDLNAVAAHEQPSSESLLTDHTNSSHDESMMMATSAPGLESVVEGMTDIGAEEPAVAIDEPAQETESALPHQADEQHYHEQPAEESAGATHEQHEQHEHAPADEHGQAEFEAHA